MAARFSLSSDSDSEPSEEVEEGESGSFVTEEERQALSRHTLTLPELRLTGRKQFFSALNKETALSLLFTSHTTGCSGRPASCDSRGHLRRFNGHKDVYYVAECANCSHHHVPLLQQPVGSGSTLSPKQPPSSERKSSRRMGKMRPGRPPKELRSGEGPDRRPPLCGLQRNMAGSCGE